MQRVVRFPDWASRLQAFLLSRDSRSFEWGVNDCALFSCDAILAMTGTDIAEPYRNRYSTACGSLRTIRRVTGGATVEDAATHAASCFDLKEIAPRLTKRGDLVLLENQAGQLLGIAALDGKLAVAVAETGSIFLPLTCAIRAWRI